MLPTAHVAPLPVGLAPSLECDGDTAAQAPALSAFSDPVLAADGSVTGAWRSRFRLGGLHCAGCAPLIESLLQALPGVQLAQVHPQTQRLTLVWSPMTAPSAAASPPSCTHTESLRALHRCLRSAGYTLVPDLPAPAQALRKAEHRQALWRLFVAGFLMMQVMMLAWPIYVAAPGDMTSDVLRLLHWGQWVLTAPVMVFAAGPLFRSAWTQWRRRHPGMDVPVVLALAVAFAASTWATFDPEGPAGPEVYFDSITMFVTFLLGARYLDLRARHRAAAALDTTQGLTPSPIERCLGGGRTEWVDESALQPGDRIRSVAGQQVPVDAQVETGTGAVDEAMVTGEARPVPKAPGDTVLAGSLNLSGVMWLRVLRVGAQTRRAGLERLMQQAWQERPPSAALAQRVAMPFLIAVLTLAVLAGLAWWIIEPARALAVSLSVLIVTCPCALSLAAPTAWVAAAGALARRGLWLRRLEVLEALGEVDRVLVDKTGTLTQPIAAAVEIADSPPDARVYEAAEVLASGSLHPLSRAVMQSLASFRSVSREDARPAIASMAATECPPRPNTTGRTNGRASAPAWSTVVEIPGHGVEGIDPSGHRWRLGMPAWALRSPHGSPAAIEHQASIILSCDGIASAAWTIDEALRPDAAQAVREWQRLPCDVTLLSGDHMGRVRDVALQLGAIDWQAAATPEEKLARLQALQARGHRVLMMGDGLNDAPVLARAQVSIAMGQGTDLAKARAEAVLVGDRLEAVTLALQLGRRTRAVVRQNLIWAAAYNALCVPLALLGALPPWAAGLGMAASSLAVVLNSARLGR